MNSCKNTIARSLQIAILALLFGFVLIPVERVHAQVLSVPCRNALPAGQLTQASTVAQIDNLLANLPSQCQNQNDQTALQAIRSRAVTEAQGLQDAQTVLNQNATPEERAAANARLTERLARLGASNEGSCIPLVTFSFARCLWIPFMALLGATAMSLAGYILGWAATFFEILVKYIIVQFGSSIQTLGLLTGIHIGWEAFRDIANILIIGMFVFIAISTILGREDFGAKRLIARVLVIAVLLNFSLLFTKIIIDSSNFVAYQVYKNMGGLGNTGGTFAPSTGLADRFIQMVGATSFWKSYEAIKQFGGAIDDPNTPSLTGAGALNSLQATVGALFYGLFSSALLIIAAGIFLYGCYLIIARAFLLIFLMITSAIAFATYLIPRFAESGYGWKTWWKTLINAAVFGPLLMILLYITLLVLSGVTKTGYLGTGISDRSNLENNWSILFIFMLGIGMLYASFRVASSFSRQIAGFSEAAFPVGRALGLTAGLGGFIGREFGGRGAAAFARSRAGRWLGTRAVIGRPIRAGLHGVAATTWDVRNLPGAKTFTQAAGMGVGSASKEGFLKVQKGRKERLKQRESDRVGMFMAETRREQEARHAQEEALSEGENIKKMIKERSDLFEEANIAMNESSKPSQVSRMPPVQPGAGAPQPGAGTPLAAPAPAPAIGEQALLSQTRRRIEAGQRADLQRAIQETTVRMSAEPDSGKRDELARAVQRLSALDQRIGDLDRAIETSSLRLERLKPALDKIPKIERNRESQMSQFQQRIAREFRFGIDKAVKKDIAKGVIASVKETPDKKQERQIRELLTQIAQGKAVIKTESAAPPAPPSTKQE